MNAINRLSVAGLCLGFFVASSFSLATDPAGAARLAVPADAAIQEAVSLIRAAYEADYKAAKETGEPEALLAKLTSLAEQANTPVNKYAMLIEAENLAVQYDDVEASLEAIEKRAALFGIDGLGLRGEALERLAGPKVTGDLILLGQTTKIVDQAMQAERFEIATEAASLAVSIAKAIDREQKAQARKQKRVPSENEKAPTPTGPGLIKDAVACQTRVAEYRKLFDAYKQALKQQAASPDDSSVNSAIGRYLCFVSMDWGRGTPALAKSDIPGIKELAEEELSLKGAKAPDARKIFALAGKWWSAAQAKGTSEGPSLAMRRHAAGLYDEVIDSLTDDLERQLAENRRKELVRDTQAWKNQTYLIDLPVRSSKISAPLEMGQLTERSINGRIPQKGIFAHANSEVVFELPDGVSAILSGLVALPLNPSEGTAHPAASCKFRIVGDGKILWESGVIKRNPLTRGSIVERFEVPLARVKTLTLVTDSLGDRTADWSTWVDPVLMWQDGVSLSRWQDALRAATQNALLRKCVLPLKEFSLVTEETRRIEQPIQVPPDTGVGFVIAIRVLDAHDDSGDRGLFVELRTKSGQKLSRHYLRGFDEWVRVPVVPNVDDYVLVLEEIDSVLTGGLGGNGVKIEVWVEPRFTTGNGKNRTVNGTSASDSLVPGGR